MRSIRIRGTERESEGGASGPMDSEYGLMFHGLDVELSVDSDPPKSWPWGRENKPFGFGQPLSRDRVFIDRASIVWPY